MDILRHVMIDLETMGTTPNAAIVSIGGVIFDPYKGKISDDTFYAELAWRDQNRFVDSQTWYWWSQQPNNNAVEVLERGKELLIDALDDFTFWLPDDVKVWSNGPTFDITMLEDAFRQYKLEIPWKFWNIRDMRTIKELFEVKRGGLDTKSIDNTHHALEDAIKQAEMICSMLAKINESYYVRPKLMKAGKRR